jgi:exonuclease SbcC
MIPKRLTLRNFLSYREAVLNFDGFRVACIAGPNGAGKSSLLEAIAWAIWGQGRTVTDDDVVHLGTVEAQVELTFEHQEQLFRVVRSRHRGQGGLLEFQVKTAQGFRPLTQRGMRATQQLINQTLRLDYDTFVNSAYLRQGRADEFMLKRPSERKQILADLLKLGQYDDLAERAKERTREAKVELALLEGAIATLETQVQQRAAIAQQAEALAVRLTTLQTEQQKAQALLNTYERTQQHRQGLLQEQQLVEQQQAHALAEQERLLAEQERLCQASRQVEGTLGGAAAIEAGMATLQALEAEEEQLSAQFQQLQRWQGERDRLYQHHQAEAQAYQQELAQQQLHLTTLEQQLGELQPIRQKREMIGEAIAELQQARQRLKHLDNLQLQTTPLKQRQQTLQRQLDQAQAELKARLQAIQTSQAELLGQQAAFPQLQQAVVAVGQTLETLMAKRAYQEKVREKGVERRNFMERLQAEQRNYELQMAQLDQKLKLLQRPNACCPVCDRPLDKQHWETVLTKHQQEEEEIQNQIWAIREQLAVSEREIQVLRQEYRDLEEALADYGAMLEQRGHLQAKLDSSETLAQQLNLLTAERSHLEQCLMENAFEEKVRAELQQIEQQLAALEYDERDHALARGQVDQLRWAEIRQVELRQAEVKQAQLEAQRPTLLAAIARLEARIATLTESEAVQHLLRLDTQIADLGYSGEAHQHLRARIKLAQEWALQYQLLQQARQAHPNLQVQIHQGAEQLQAISAHLQTLITQAESLAEQLQSYPDRPQEIQHLQAQMGDRQRERETLLAQTGALEQQLAQLDQLQAELTDKQQQLLQTQRRWRVHQELTTAFGRNGLQALLIEHILPQLEAETNQILGRLSAHQLHVQFVTQKAGRSRQNKLIDTLDIVIADTQGTRAYETYSGGEAFRVNFAIRLALARLLAQRSGTPLQMLIIDEGFGTQDRDGCDRLIGAINAIAADFACILAVTHIPHFREAFDTRIDVIKTPDGSQLARAL